MQNSSLVGWGVALVVIGAVVRFAISDAVPGVNLDMLGLILIFAGIVVFALGFVPRGKHKTVSHTTRDGRGGFHREDEIR